MQEIRTENMRKKNEFFVEEKSKSCLNNTGKYK